MNVPAGVVLDQPLADALLYAAIRERLVDDEPSLGDGFVARLLRTPPPQHLIEASFEQLVLGGTAFVPFWLPPGWAGELFEAGSVLSAEMTDEYAELEVMGLPAEVVLGMLSARGVAWSEEQLSQRYGAFLDAHGAWEQIAEGKSFDGLEIRMALSGVLRDELVEYSAAQIAAWKAVQAELGQLRPVLDCVDAYRRIVGASMARDALSSVPIVPSSISTPDIGKLHPEGEHLRLLRVTCQALRRVPIASTLRGTLEIARSPEAHALRQRLAAWTAAARELNGDAADIALREIESARKCLTSSKRVARIGEYATWFGIPVSIAGAVFTGPIGIAAGIIVSVAGTVALGRQKLVERANRWAMFAAS